MNDGRPVRRLVIVRHFQKAERQRTAIARKNSLSCALPAGGLGQAPFFATERDDDSIRRVPSRVDIAIKMKGLPTKAELKH
jgi:hypothetical protein